MAEYLPPSWGPKKGLNTKDFGLWVQGTNITDPLVDLIGHSVPSPNQELSDALIYTTVIRRGGKIVPIQYVSKTAQELSRTYTIGIPSALWTPVTMKAMSQGCVNNFYLIYNCPEDVQFNYFQVLTQGILSPVVPSTDIIVSTEDDAVWEFTSDLRVSQALDGFILGGSVLYDATDAMLDFDFLYDDCEGCGTVPAFDYIMTGTPVALSVTPLIDTDDRFTTPNVGELGTVADDVGTVIQSFGSTVLAFTADDVDYSLATTGIIHVSYDKGVTFAEFASTIYVHDFVKLGNIFLGVGFDGANAGIIASFNSGNSWSVLANATINALVSELVSASFDEEKGIIFIATNAGELLKMRFSSGALSGVEITANLSGAPASLNFVEVLDTDFLVVGGDAGVFQESFDGGATFNTIGIAATQNAVALAGNAYRQMLVTQDTVYFRDPLTSMVFKTRVLEDGATVTGAWVQVRMYNVDDLNYFAALTDGGEVALFRGFYPAS